MEYIKGITFGAFAGAGSFERREAYQSIDNLIERTGANYVILVPNGLQETPQSQKIDFTTLASLMDDELIRMIDYIHSKGLKVALKPTVNCKNGTWRAHICFFDIDVPTEPKWSTWFKAYTLFQQHYAAIAESTGCEMFIAGCEMVMSEHREAEWRALIADIRKLYSGPVTYNTDKYQEDNVSWWDCIDYISSSGYYPIDDINTQLARIEKVVRRFNKPFFFGEVGCKSVDGSQNVPNDWKLQGEISMDAQYDWYQALFNAMKEYDFINGYVVWDWNWKQYSEKNAVKDGSYDIYCKPAEKLICDFNRGIQ